MYLKYTKKVPTVSVISLYCLFIIIGFFLVFFTLCKRYFNVVTGQIEVNLNYIIYLIMHNAENDFM